MGFTSELAGKFSRRSADPPGLFTRFERRSNAGKSNSNANSNVNGRPNSKPNSKPNSNADLHSN